MAVPVTGLVMVVCKLLGWSKVQVEEEQIIFQEVSGEPEAKVKAGPVAVPPPTMVGVAAPLMVTPLVVEIVMLVPALRFHKVA